MPSLLPAVLGVCATALGAAACGQVLGDVQVYEVSLRPRDAGAPSQSVPPEPFRRECELGQAQCDGTFIKTCVALREGEPPGWVARDCAPDGTCVDDPSPRCAVKACELGQAECRGATPRVCSEDQTEWQTLDRCQSAAHCSAEPEVCGQQGAPCCLLAPCETGDLRCNGGVMERCNGDQTDWDPYDECLTPELCLDGLDQCGGRGAGCGCQRATCEPGETRCVGTTLEMCLLSLTGWQPISECETPELCEAGLDEASASCVAPACDPGQMLCTPQGVLQVCRTDRTGYQLQQACEGPQFCNVVDGRCESSACSPGEMRCNGRQIQVCADDQTGFQDVGPPCATAQLCDASNPLSPICRQPACDFGEFRCLGIGQPQRCNGGRTGFQNEGRQCARSDLCSEARQRCDTCVPGRQECTNGNRARRTCNFDGNGFGPVTDCPLGCAPVTGQCQN